MILANFAGPNDHRNVQMQKKIGYNCKFHVFVFYVTCMEYLWVDEQPVSSVWVPLQWKWVIPASLPLGFLLHVVSMISPLCNLAMTVTENHRYCDDKVLTYLIDN